MEHKKSNHSWDEEEIKKYLEQSAEAEEMCIRDSRSIVRLVQGEKTGAVRAGTLLFWNHLLFCHRSRNRWNLIHKIWFTYHMGFLRLFIDQF